MKSIKGKIVTIILIGSLFFCVSYLIKKRFYINYELSAISSYVDTVKSALDTLDK